MISRVHLHLYKYNKGFKFMASLFECEVRYSIADIKIFEKRLRTLGAKLIYKYEFIDYYFMPKKEKWNPIEKILRIREWKFPKKPTTIYFTKNEIISTGNIKFKRAVYQDGKVPLFIGGLDICKSLLNDLGFKLWFILKKKKCKFWHLPKYNFKTVTEFIDGLGWSGELEFEGRNMPKTKIKIEKALDILKIPKDLISFKPISVIFDEKRKNFK